MKGEHTMKITAPTPNEALSMLYREVLADKDFFTEEIVRELLAHVGVDYEEAKAKAEADPRTDEEIMEEIMRIAMLTQA